MKNTPKTSQGLKNVLFNTLDNVLSDKPDYKRANVVCKTVKTIVDISRTELEYSKFNIAMQKEKTLTDVDNVKTINMR